MAKGYWIVNNEITDAEAYEGYKKANAAPLKKHGARFLVRGGAQQAREGDAFPRSVVIEFPSYEAALACYDDPDYQAAVAIRTPAADGRFIIAEGWDE